MTENFDIRISNLDAVFGEAVQPRIVLAIGMSRQGTRRLLGLPEHAGVFSTCFDMIDATMLSLLDPVAVITPAIAGPHDCYDVAERLTRLGYSGRMILSMGGIKNVSLVLGDARREFPHLRFSTLPPTSCN